MMILRYILGLVIATVAVMQGVAAEEDAVFKSRFIAPIKWLWKGNWKKHIRAGKKPILLFVTEDQHFYYHKLSHRFNMFYSVIKGMVDMYAFDVYPRANK
jgi:hypothetical protein